MKYIISREMSQRMRGVAILLICLHNLLHLDSYVMECEFAFLDYRIERLLRCFSFTSWSAVEYFFSFFGWYGVPVFMFLSGYGLVAKHERNGVKLQTWPYLRRNFVKLFLLMVPAYLLFLLADRFVNSETPDILTFLSHLTLTHNFWDAEGINPGVYWYFGLTMQFYIVYLLFYYQRSSWVLAAVCAVSLLAGEYYALVMPDSPAHFLMRHNCLLWLPVFVMGVWVARNPDSSLLVYVMKYRWFSLLVVLLLWVYTSIDVATWVLSPIFSVIVLMLLCGDGVDGSATKSTSWSGRFFAYVGSVSAGIFVLHPILRVFGRPLLQHEYNPLLIGIVYVVLCILLAAAYMKFYQRILPFEKKKG